MKIKKNILITGGLGFIGQNLVKFFLRKSFKVHIIDNLSSINSSKNYLFDKKKVKIFFLDISDYKKISSFFKKNKYDYIVHAAANFANQNSIEHPIKDMKTNIQGSINIFETARKVKLKKIIYLSSSCVYPSKKNLYESMFLKPIETPYAISKFTGELYAEFYSNFYKMPINVIRIFNTYGPGEKSHKYRNVIPNFIDAALNDKKLKITGDGNEVRDFTFIEDAAEIIYKCLMLKKNKYLVINSCTGKYTKIIDLAKKIKLLTKSNSKIQVINKLRAWDKIKIRAGSTKKNKKILNKKSYTGIDEGLKKTIRWYKNNI